VHTHSFFGLHCDCDNAHVVESVSSCCGSAGCCTDDRVADVSAEEDDVVSALHDCSLCKFFKYLNYSAADCIQWSSYESANFVAFCDDRLLFAEPFSSRARGPPELS